MFLTDAHTHSHHSHDGCEPVAALCESACDRRLSALCLTDHYDAEGRFNPKAYRAEIEQTRAAFAGRLELLCGVELGEGHLTPERSAALLAAAPFDLVLGSCHHLEGQPDFYWLRYTSRAHCRQLIGDYLDELVRMISWGGFDVLAHLTYPLRYMADRDGFDVDFMCHEDKVRAVFRALARSRRGLELNVSGLRRGSFAMPDVPLLRLYRACGGEFITVGSDAHHAREVGVSVAEGVELLRAAGFSRMAVYRKRQVHWVST